MISVSLFPHLGATVAAAVASVAVVTVTRSHLLSFSPIPFKISAFLFVRSYRFILRHSTNNVHRSSSTLFECIFVVLRVVNIDFDPSIELKAESRVPMPR